MEVKFPWASVFFVSSLKVMAGTTEKVSAFLQEAAKSKKRAARYIIGDFIDDKNTKKKTIPTFLLKFYCVSQK